MVTAVSSTPEAGFRLVIEGGGITVKLTGLLATPFNVTTT